MKSKQTLLIVAGLVIALGLGVLIGWMVKKPKNNCKMPSVSLGSACGDPKDLPDGLTDYIIANGDVEQCPTRLTPPFKIENGVANVTWISTGVTMKFTFSGDLEKDKSGTLTVFTPVGNATDSGTWSQTPLGWDIKVTHGKNNFEWVMIYASVFKKAAGEWNASQQTVKVW